MRIGVALSGCDIGGVGAFAVLEELEKQGLGIAMISACGLPAVTALPWAFGLGTERCRELAGGFLSSCEKDDLDTAIARISAGLSLQKRAEKRPIAVSAVGVMDGRVLTFTNDYRLSGDQVTTHPIEDAYDIFSATVSPMDGLSGYLFQGRRLCDYSVWYGCPVAPLKVLGQDRILSVSFLPKNPVTPYGVLVKRRISSSEKGIGLHLTLEQEEKPVDEYIAYAAEAIRKNMEELVLGIL